LPTRAFTGQQVVSSYNKGASAADPGCACRPFVEKRITGRVSVGAIFQLAGSSR
jgi:hypothetical protein